MIVELTKDEYDMIMTSLEYTRRNFENYPHYPSYEFRCAQLKSVDDLRAKLINAKKQAGQK